MGILWDVFLFLLFIVVFLIVPAEAFFRTISGELDPWKGLGVSLITGLCLFILLTISTRLIGLPFFVLWAVPVIAITRKPKPGNLKKLLAQPVLLLLLAICVLTQSAEFLISTNSVNGNLHVIASHDTMWNLSIMSRLQEEFPPQHPGFAGEILKNNHYFYPLFLAAGNRLFGLPGLFLYFKAGPVFTSLLFGLGLYAVSGIFFVKPVHKYFAVFLGYFSGNTAYILPLFLGKNYNWQNNSFMSDQPFDQIINPYSVIGYAAILFGIYFIFKFFKYRKFSDALVIGLVLGTLFGIKSFAAVVGWIGLIVTTLVMVLKYRQRLDFLPLLFTILISLPLYFLITSGPSAIVWQPGWTLREMMVSSDKLNQPWFGTVIDYYSSINNYLGTIKYFFYALLIYIPGNLGLRILGVVGLVYISINTNFQSLSRKAPLLFIVAAILSALSIPLLFNLRYSTHNIVQFTPYALVLLTFPMSWLLVNWWSGFAKNKYPIFGRLLIASIIVLAIYSNLYNLKRHFPPNPDIIKSSEIEALTFLSRISLKHEVLLIDPREYEDEPMYIATLSNLSLFYSGRGLTNQTGIDGREREQKVAGFFDGKNPTNLFDSFNYIYLRLPYPVPKFLETDLLRFGRIFENDVAVIFVNIQPSSRK